MTETTVNANDVLMGGGGAPSARFNEPGATYTGRIIHPPQAYQEREWNLATMRSDGPPATFPSGDPIMAISVDIKTTLRDATIEDDDGTRRVYIQGKRLKEAVRNAVRDAGAHGLEVGGELTVTFTHQEDPTDKRSAKHYTATYVSAASAGLMTPDPTVQETGYGQAGGPAPAPSGPAQPTPEQVQGLVSLKIPVRSVYPHYTGPAV